MAALGLNYMGTKRTLAPLIADVVSEAKPGPVLDCFSGMCAVGQAIGPRRLVWNNDVQLFATAVARALFVAPDHPPRVATVAPLVFDDFERNRRELISRVAPLLGREEQALQSRSASELKVATERSRALCTDDVFRRELRALREVPRTFPYRLFTYMYAGTYLGLRQCIEVDSLVYAIHCLVGRRRLTRGQASWLLISIGKAIQRVATTTGHFAQYLELKKDSADRYIRQRARSVWEEWLDAIPTEPPLGDWDWRARNRVYRTNAVSLLTSLRSTEERPSVVYADPPYTSDHYSRYYHLLETLLKYDYPRIEGKARCRTKRFATPFSIKSKAEAAFEQLAAATARLGADLVISYPKQGLLSEIGLQPAQLIRPFFRTVEICGRISHKHSTHGASKGPASKLVTEIIYWAKP